MRMRTNFRQANLHRTFFRQANLRPAIFRRPFFRRIFFRLYIFSSIHFFRLCISTYGQFSLLHFFVYLYFVCTFLRTQPHRPRHIEWHFGPGRRRIFVVLCFRHGCRRKIAAQVPSAVMASPVVSAGVDAAAAAAAAWLPAGHVIQPCQYSSFSRVPDDQRLYRGGE